MEKPFAITLDVGSSLANKTGSWRTERPVYVDRLPPCNDACPAGENIQGWLYEAEEGGEATSAPGARSWTDNPFPAIMGRVCYHPCETRLQPRPARRGGRHQLGRALPRRRGDRAGLDSSRPRAAVSGKRVLVVGAGPSGLSAAYHLARLGHEVTIHEAGPLAGGMMRFGIPAVPAAARRARRRDAADPRPGRRARAEPQGRRTSLDAMRDGRLRRRLPRRRRPHRQARLHPGRRGRAHPRRGRRCCASMEGEERPLLGRRVVVYGGGNTAMDAARTAQAARRRRGDRRLPPHPRPDAGPRLRGRGGRARRA